jgi:hypothetical protein
VYTQLPPPGSAVPLPVITNAWAPLALSTLSTLFECAEHRSTMLCNSRLSIGTATMAFDRLAASAEYLPPG